MKFEIQFFPIFLSPIFFSLIFLSHIFLSFSLSFLFRVFRGFFPLGLTQERSLQSAAAAPKANIFRQIPLAAGRYKARRTESRKFYLSRSDGRLLLAVLASKPDKFADKKEHKKRRWKKER